MIRAQSADGVIHEFPDGTADAVVDKAMRSYAQDSAPKARRGALGYLADEVGGAVTGAVNKLAGDVKSDYERKTAQAKAPLPDAKGFVKGAVEDFGRTARMVGDVVGAVASPVVGVQEAALVKPYGAGMAAITKRPAEEWQSDMRTALMGARPGAVPAPNALAVRAIKPGSLPAKVDAFDRAGVSPNVAATQGGFAAKAANFTAENPVGFGPRNVLAKQATQAQEKTNALVQQYGQPSSRVTQGEAIQSGVKTFAQGSNGKATPPTDVARQLSSQRLSFGDKADALYTRAERLVKDPNQPIQLNETSRALAEATQRFTDPNLNARFKNAVLEGIGEDVAAAGGQISWQDAARLRTNIRQRLLADPALRATVDDATVNRVYDALTTDLEAGAAALGGPEAARAWQQANRFYRTGRARMDAALNGVFDASSGERVYDQVVAAAGSSSRADIRKLTSLKRSLQSDQWGDLAATVLDNLGKPSPGAANAAEDGAWSLGTFMTNYAKLSEEGRAVLFGSTAGGGAKASGLKGELDNLARVMGMLKAVQKGANASNTGTAMQGFATVGALANPVTFAPALKALAGMALTGEVLTNPVAVRALSAISRAAQLGPQALASQVGRLQQAARANASLMPLYQEVQRALAAHPVAPAPAATVAAQPEQPQQ